MKVAGFTTVGWIISLAEKDSLGYGINICEPNVWYQIPIFVDSKVTDNKDLHLLTSASNFSIEQKNSR